MGHKIKSKVVDRGHEIIFEEIRDVEEDGGYQNFARGERVLKKTN